MILLLEFFGSILLTHHDRGSGTFFLSFILSVGESFFPLARG